MSQPTLYDELVLRARNIAFEAAAAAVEITSRQSSINLAMFCRILEAHISAELPAAVADAEEAWGAGLELTAVVTFETSMRLAGVRAVNELLMTENCP